MRVQIQMDGERVTEVKEAGKLIRIVEDELGPITIFRPKQARN